MASGKRKLKVRFTDSAQLDLGNIWIWNASRHSANWADAYHLFLKACAQKLETEFETGEIVPQREELRFIVCRKSRRKNSGGHILVYRVKDSDVQIIYIFHTSEKWTDKI